MADVVYVTMPLPALYPEVNRLLGVRLVTVVLLPAPVSVSVEDAV